MRDEYKENVSYMKNTCSLPTQSCSVHVSIKKVKPTSGQWPIQPELTPVSVELRKYM